MKKLTLFTLIISSYLVTQAQTDTVFTYYNFVGQTNNKESSVTYTKQYTSGEIWIKEYYNTNRDELTMRVSYLNKDCKILQGNSDDFFPNGNVKSRHFYVNNQLVWGKYFYPNGQLNGAGSYDANGNVVKHEGYDTSGNKIKGYIFFRESAFKGGVDGWINYLQTHLKVDMPSRNGAPVGRYTVVLSFVVDKDGKVTNVTAADDPGYGTKEEAIRVLQDGPKWIPAMENNRFVISRKRQSISFLVQ